MSVVYKGDQVATAPQELKFLRSHPQWVNADSMLGLLRLRLRECGPYAYWKDRRVPAAEASRLCLDEYEHGLQALAAIYAEIDRETDPRCAAIHASRARIAALRQALRPDGP
ncbi:hypothetical protein [Streptomyces sp. NPDC052012]|uniref:hypothetical protein n=1 Tax=Streptomyces sp. NPDC052012 TaxID=3155051 RepID=UPI0034505032